MDEMEYIEEPDGDEDERKGLPAYMGTFADLMALLLCFFVLLLSFSEMDALRYTEVIKSLKNAFGVQRDYPAMDIPMGTSIITQNFSPGEPKPTPVIVVERQSGDDNNTLMNEPSSDKESVLSNERSGGEDELLKSKVDVLDAAIKAHKENIELEARRIEEALEGEISAGLIEVEGNHDRIIIRIRENGSFGSGDDEINESFKPVIKTIGETLSNMSGGVAVSGHTDNVPINNFRFNSNWVLSTSRATQVVSLLESFGDIDSERLVVEGYADKRPVDTNDTPEGRANNRRVEVTLLKSLGDSAGEELGELNEVISELYGDRSAEDLMEESIPEEPVSEVIQNALEDDGVSEPLMPSDDPVEDTP